MAEPLPHLETFAVVAEASSFTAAAHTLSLTQAAISQRIQALERTLGVSLFQRGKGPLLLTEAGRALYPLARQILDLHDTARQQLTGRKTPLTGELLLAASSIPGEHLLPDLLSGFQKRHPHIRVRATVGDTQAVLKQVERGQAHLGLVGATGEQPNLAFRPFAVDEMVLVVPPEHPWHTRRRVALKQVCRQPLILRESGSGSRWCLEQALERAGVVRNDLHIALELGSNEAIKEAVERGLGLAFLSALVVRRELQAGRLHSPAVSGLVLQRDICLVWDERRILPIPAQLFLDFIMNR